MNNETKNIPRKSPIHCAICSSRMTSPTSLSNSLAIRHRCVIRVMILEDYLSTDVKESCYNEYMSLAS